MKFSEIVEQAKALLQRKERISYRALKMEFDLDDEQLDVLKEELVDVEELAVDKDGKMLVWAGSLASSVQRLETKQIQSPASKSPIPNPQAVIRPRT